MLSAVVSFGLSSEPDDSPFSVALLAHSMYDGTMTTPKTSTELDLVSWDYANYQGTGEGGLFAYAVWSLDEVFNSLSGPVLNSFPQLTQEDVLAGVKGAEAAYFWKRADNLQRLRYSFSNDELELEEFRRAVKTPVTVFLGATDSSLYDESLGEYFAVDRENLTDRGLTLITALEAVYGPATYLTFLDT